MANSNLIIGLTGGISTGKSTVADMFKTLGAIIIDADIIARKVVQPTTSVWQAIVDFFGQGILNADLSINRERLADLVFSESSLLQKLNEITHPEIRDKIEKEISTFTPSKKIIIIDAPLLIESQMISLVDKLFVVHVSEKIQIERLMKRNNFNEQEAKNRIHAQIPLEEKLKLADIVIDNNGTIEELREKIKQIWEVILFQRKYV